MSRREPPRARSRFFSYSIAFGRPTLADRFFERGLLSDAVLIFVGAALTAILAQVVIPLWPMPATAQTLGVLVVGGTLGAVRAALSMALYFAMAVIGLPVLSAGVVGVEHFASSTAVYLYGFIVATALVGWLAQRSRARRVPHTFLSFLAGSAVMLAFSDALNYGAVILLPAALLNSVLATIVVALVWRVVDGEDRQRAADDLAVRD